MMKNFCVLMLTTLLAGCSGTAYEEKNGLITDPEWETTRLVAYSGLFGKTLGDARLADITRYELVAAGPYRDGRLWRFNATCPIAFAVDDRGIVLKVLSLRDETGDCETILDDFRTFVRTGKTYAERRQERRDRLLSDALDREGSPQYYSLLRQAASLGSVGAQVEIGRVFGETGSEKEWREALDRLRKAAEAGEPSAGYILGKYYLSLGTEDDMAFAYALFQRAAVNAPDGKSALYVAAMRKQLGESEKGRSILKKGEKFADGFVP